MQIPIYIVVLVVLLLIVLLFLSIKYKQQWKKAELDAQSIRNQYQSVIGSANDAIILIDHQSQIKSWNHGAEKIFHFQEREVLDENLLQIIPERYREAHIEGVNRYLSTNKTKIIGKTVELNGLKKDGKEIPIELSVSTWKMNNKTHFSGIIRDITERKQAEEKFNFLAFNDELTKLPNRRFFNQTMEKEMDNSKRNGKLLILMMLDLDRFKIVNDTYGHSVGDLLLIEIANRLNAVIEDKGIVARMGGDEFMLLMSGVQQISEATDMANKILSVIKEPVVIQEHTLLISTSIGIVRYPDDGDDVESLMKKADIAMYRAKEMGKSTYTFYFLLEEVN